MRIVYIIIYFCTYLNVNAILPPIRPYCVLANLFSDEIRLAQY